MSSIFGLQSSYMLEYCWLFALFLRSARCFTGAEGKWTPLPPILPPSSLFSELHFLSEEVSETQEAQTTGNFCEDRHNRSCNGSGSSHTGCCTRALGLSLGKTWHCLRPVVVHEEL